MTMTRYLFDTGPEGADLTTTNTGANQVNRGTNATAVFAAAMASAGGFGAKFTANAANAIARLLGDAGNNQYAFSGVLTTPDVAPNSTELTVLSFRHASGVIARLRVDSAGRWFVTDSASKYYPGAAAQATALPWGTKYRVEVVITGGSTSAGAFTVHFYSGSTLVLTISGTDANFTANPIVGVDIGNHSGVAVQQTVGWDTIQLDSGKTTEIGEYVPGANNPPTVSAGANQSVPAGATVTLTGTATDTDGAIASRKWTIDGFPAGSTAPTVTNSTSASATFVASAPGVYVARFTATDNAGASATSTVKVFVPTSTVTVIGVTENSGIFTSPTNVATALSDSDLATIIESPASPVSEKTVTYRLAPLNPLTSGTIELTGVQMFGSGSITAKARLLEGTTVRKEWALTLTGTASTLSLPLSSTEAAAIDSWSELNLQFAVQAA